MNVDFWYDPGCPFCWVTSRWINRVAPHRDLQVNWRSISLLFKNDPPEDSPFHGAVSRTRDLLRVGEATRDAGHADRIGDLYTEFGRRIHNRGERDFDVAAILDELGLDESLAKALDDPQWDDAIRASMAEGLALTGDDVGTPIIAVDGRQGRVGLFGPVITELPNLDDSLDLWDGFVKMVDTPGFYELKRTRTHGPTAPPEDALD